MGNDVKAQTNLVRRGRVYYFRARVPQDLRSHYGKNEITRSLRTSDQAQALQLVRLERLKQDQEFHQARAVLGAAPLTELGDIEAQRLAAMWGAEVLELDEMHRVSGLTDFMHEALGVGLDEEEPLFREALALGRIQPIESAMGSFLKHQGIKIEKGSGAYRQLCYEFLKQAVKTNGLLRARQAGEVVETPRVEAPTSRSALVPREEDTLEALLAYWKTQGEKRPKTIAEAETAVKRFRAVVGDIPASRIGKGHVVAFKDALLGGGKAANTVLKLLGLLRAIFQAAEDNGKLPANPALGVKVPRPKVRQKARVPFSPEDLHTLFHSEVFTQGKRPRGGRGEAAFWLPLIALWTGARMDEIGQLLVADVRQEGGVHYFHITDSLEDGKQVKTESSRRRVPVHGELTRCGLLGYVESMRGQGGGRLFPLLGSGEGRHLTASYSQWFGRYLRETVGITDPRKVFHSFRHGFKDACRACGIDKEHHDRMTGHRSGDVGDGYGGDDYPLAPLVGAMERLCYPGLDLSHLHK